MMKLAIILTIFLILITGCSKAPESPSVPVVTAPVVTHTVSSAQELTLSGQDLTQLGMALNGTNCSVDTYETSEYSPLAQYSMCTYFVNSLNDTIVIIELKKFADDYNLNYSYQYDSGHLFSSEGIISKNDYGDQSIFRMNNEHDYGGEFNDPNRFYYHLWFTKGQYIVHITSGGSSKDAKEYIENTGHTILSKFE